jgi:nitric oxide reductase large subunit
VLARGSVFSALEVVPLLFVGQPAALRLLEPERRVLAMVVISLLPVGLMQTWAAVEYGYRYARTPEFLQRGVIDLFRWLRVVGDTIFAPGTSRSCCS